VYDASSKTADVVEGVLCATLHICRLVWTSQPQETVPTTKTGGTPTVVEAVPAPAVAVAVAVAAVAGRYLLWCTTVTATLLLRAAHPPTQQIFGSLYYLVGMLTGVLTVDPMVLTMATAMLTVLMTAITASALAQRAWVVGGLQLRMVWNVGLTPVTGKPTRWIRSSQFMEGLPSGGPLTLQVRRTRRATLTMVRAKAAMQARVGSPRARMVHGSSVCHHNH
jgi:hypothetical protein